MQYVIGIDIGGGFFDSEVVSDAAGKRIRCARCGPVFCRLGEEWKNKCKRPIFPPVKAGPLTDELFSPCLLEKLYCPACAVLLDSEMVEETSARHRTAKHWNLPVEGDAS